MSMLWVKPSVVDGDLYAPPSKSHSQRAIFFASLAKGTSHIAGILPSPDIEAMITACRQMGAVIKQQGNTLLIEGVNASPKCPDDIIDAGNSGQVLRFIGAMAGLIDSHTVITGDASIRNLRPVQALLSGLQQFGCQAISTRGNGFAPIVVRGPIGGGRASIDGHDSQPVSALLMACAFAKYPSEISVINPGETPWVGLTLDWLKRLNIPFEASPDFGYYRLTGNAQVLGFKYQVPGDFSSIAFPLVAAALTGGSLSITNIDMQDAQGDKAIVDVLQQLGFPIVVNHNTLVLEQKCLHSFKGFDIDVNSMVDALPILAVLACFAQSQTRLYGAEIVKSKESNRIETICSELNRMGGKLTPLCDGIIIQPSQLIGAQVYSYHDHRIAMALAVAAFKASGETRIVDTDCIAKSYPDFVAVFQKLGADIVKA